ncbi:MAG: tetratricopeptide repeat protein [Candidatus Hydrogenedentes bacterium]|nr:tetratricopeptide repeat protein [Candidatus Hydrogenedentota bacterium]
MTGRKRALLYAVAVFAAAVAAHVFCSQSGFVDYDDDDYVFLNPHVSAGLSLDNVRWAFTTGHAANYHPLTWLSHMLDVSIWQLEPRGHHITNLVLHALNSLLVFVLLLRMTHRAPESWAAALIFAVHPLHVESVAWVSERKDLLCAFFMLMTLLAYTRYTLRRSIVNYGLLAFAFLCALLSKPMAVTLPFVLLLLDYWPLQRMNDVAQGDTFPLRARRLVLEKAPLFAMAALLCVVTYFVQWRGGAMNAFYQMPIAARIENALVAYVLYLWKLFWPFNLSPIYPLPEGGRAAWQVLLAGLLLIGVTGVLWMRRKRAPFALMGWLWYLGILVPAIGIVQVGFAAMADRYMYLPMTGVLVAVIWSGSDMLRGFDSERTRSTVFAFGFILVAGLAALSHKQTAIWKVSESLFKHAIAVTKDNAEAHAHLGVAYLRQNRPADAIAPFEQAVAFRPGLKEAHTGLGVAFRMTGEPERAILSHQASLKIDPNQPIVYANLGVAYEDVRNYAEAERNLREAIRLDPSLASARSALNRVLQAQGKPAE